MSLEQQVSIVDLRNLAQTDIQRLATSNPSHFDTKSLTTIIPILDPSTFNESASSRKQTFSRLPLTTNSNNAEVVPNPNTRRVGRPVNPNPGLGLRPRDDDVENKENLQIVSALKKLFAIREKGESFEKLDREVRNLNGEEIDLEELGMKADLYDEVIRKKTEGLEKEEQLLGYITALDGEWGSSRKKRKIVDAGVFGCELPKGWKVLLGLKRKKKRVFLHCREYVSPSGKHFVSCKDVSSYILSINGQHDSSQQISAQHALSASETAKAALVNVTDQTDHEVNKIELGNCSYVTPISYISTECEKQGQLFKNTDKPEKSLQCQKCNLTFVDEPARSHHLSTSHRSDKRLRLGQSFTEGVTMKDGKYECQLCHKTFTEKHRYNRHIGAHIRYGSLKKGNGGVIEGARSISNSSASLIPYDQSKNNIFVNADAQASVHYDSAENITEAVSKEGEHHLNESVTEGARDTGNSTSPSLMPDQSKDDITVKENAEVSTDNDSAKHTTEAVSKESEHNVDGSVIVGAIDISKSSSASLGQCDQSKNNVSTDENAEASLHEDSAKHITEAVSKEAEHSLKASIHTDVLSVGNFVDNPFKDGVRGYGDTKGITCDDGTMDMSPHACTNITSPSRIYVNNKFYASSPAITEVLFTKKSVHNLTYECEVTHTSPSPMPDQFEHDITVKENAEASSHNDSAKHTTEAVSKESEHNLDESIIVGAMDISRSSSASLRPCDRSKNNVSTNENAEASLHEDSAKHITEAVSKEAEHSLKASTHNDVLSVSNFFDIPFKDGVPGYGDTKAITWNDGTMDLSSHAYTNITSPSGIYVNNKFDASSPAITEVPFTKKSIHNPINEREVTHTKSGILDDLNAESKKSKVYQDSPSPSAYENKTNSVAGGCMVDSMTETQLAASRVISKDISEEIFDIPVDNCVGGQTNNCDRITDNRSDALTSTSTSVVSKTETHLATSRMISMDTAEEIFENPKDNYEGVQTKNCEIVTDNSTGATDTSTGMSVDSKTETYLAASRVIPMDIPEEIFEIPQEHSVGGKTNNCGIVTDNNSDVVCTSNPMSVEANAYLNSLSPSLNNIDGTRDVQPNAIESDDRNKLEEHHFLSFSGNEPKFAGETYGGFFTSKENEMVESDDYMHGKGIFASTMHNELSTNCNFPNIANEPTSGTETNADCMFPGDLNKSLFDDEADNIGYEFQKYFESRNVRNENASSDIMENSDGTQALQIASTVPEQSSPWVQTADSLNFLDLMPNQCTNNPRSEQERISGFDDLSLGSIEPSDFALFTGQSSTSATRSPMELFPDHQLEWGMSFNKIPTNSAPTAVCAWCTREFSLQGYETDPQSGSFGYICPDCKAQISGQFGMFNNGFS